MQPGDRIRDYNLDRKIGEGGMGEVWLARHEHLGQLAAIKTLSHWGFDDPRFRTLFSAEAKILMALHHRRIAGAHEYFEDEGRPFLVMR